MVAFGNIILHPQLIFWILHWLISYFTSLNFPPTSHQSFKVHLNVNLNGSDYTKNRLAIILHYVHININTAKRDWTNLGGMGGAGALADYGMIINRGRVPPALPSPVPTALIAIHLIETTLPLNICFFHISCTMVTSQNFTCIYYIVKIIYILKKHNNNKRMKKRWIRQGRSLTFTSVKGQKSHKNQK